MRFKPIITAALLAATLPLTAQAEMEIGGNAGSARVNEGDFTGNDTGFKIHLGGSYKEIIGGELAYTDFGRLGGSNGPRARAWTPAVIAGIPIGMANLYGKVGVAFEEVQHTSVRDEYKNQNAFYGVGFRVGHPTGVGLRLEYERYRFQFENVDMAQAGLEFRFGAPSHRDD